jgi:hypothetical protein
VKSVLFVLDLRVTLFAGLPKSVTEQEVCVCVCVCVCEREREREREMDEQRGVIVAYLLVLND